MDGRRITMSSIQKVLDGVMSINNHMDEMGELLDKQLESGSPDMDICKDAVLNIFVSAQIRIIALDATLGIFNQVDIDTDEELEKANSHAWKMLESIQQAYQILANIFMKADEEELGVEFSDEVMTPLLSELSEEHFPEILAGYASEVDE